MVLSRTRAVAGVHGFLALLHIFWATGATWPASDERSLSMAVLGGEASFAPRIVLPLAAFHLITALAVLTAARHLVSQLAVLALLAGLTGRAAVGLVWALGIGTDSSTPFYWLNLFLYTPACLMLAVADYSILRNGRAWWRRTAVAVPLAVVMALSLTAYGSLLPSATVRVLGSCGHARTLDCSDGVTQLMEDSSA
jgi:hypothetical protein